MKITKYDRIEKEINDCIDLKFIFTTYKREKTRESFQTYLAGMVRNNFNISYYMALKYAKNNYWK